MRRVWPNQPLRDDEKYLEVQICTWPDGSDAIVRLHHEPEHTHNTVEFILRWADDYGPEDFVNPDVGIVEPVFSIESFPRDEGLVSMETPPIYPERLNRKVLGLLLDIGIEGHPQQGPSLVFCTDHTFISSPIVGAYPRWVPDELWGSRFELAKEFLSPEAPYSDKYRSGPYRPRSFIFKPHSVSNEAEALYGTVHFQYFVIRNGKISTSAHTSHPRGWTVIWGDNHQGPSEREAVWDDDFSAAVDKALAAAMILPISQKDAWENERVERGTPTIISPEEAEVFKILDEPLPFWWGYADLLEWLRGRQ